MNYYHKLFTDDKSVNNENYLFAIFKSTLLMIILISITLFSFKYREDLTILILLLIATFTAVYISKKINIDVIKFKKINLYDLLYLFLGYLIILSTDLIYIFFNNQEIANQSNIEKSFENFPLMSLIILLALIPAIIEEYVFRGLVLRVFFRNHLFLGLVASSILFALYHESMNITGYIPYFISGVIFSLIYLKTKKIEVSIGAHFLNNFIGVIQLYYF